METALQYSVLPYLPFFGKSLVWKEIIHSRNYVKIFMLTIEAHMSTDVTDLV